MLYGKYLILVGLVAVPVTRSFLKLALCKWVLLR
jgi:hypothetical protein